MTSVERIVDYTKLPSEAPLKTDTALAISKGRIEFNDVFMRYREHLDYALKDFSLVIEPASKVGVVGRTGAGKSTILQTLFRLIETEKGKISIDGQNISSVGLHVLRS
jgi:ABC-type multidrug transport system fused ATPase/permease subunit